MLDDEERFEVYVYLADRVEDDTCRYTIEHWFTERPDIETVAALLDEARRDFARLYPDVTVENASINVNRLRAKDLGPQRG
jgi:hypothetical protein